MKAGFYPKLAFQGIKKNGKVYIPYIITGIVMAAMFYIISFLSMAKSVKHMHGGSNMQIILSFGIWVIAIFTVIFLFYTNSFIVKKRKKEFGLYNILGMDKRNVAKVLFYEAIIVFAISIVGGIATGILFSKLTELIAAKVLHAESTLSFEIEPDAVILTVIVFAAAFGINLIRSLAGVKFSKPIELLHSEHSGEKPPKAKWLLTLLGIIGLAAAYYMAVTIKEPMEAMATFFLAVILVIVSTYILMISGSVALCKALQKNKKYYYKTNHFVSVSTMAYRMKRNGASLASICILSTMVLVMMMSTLCLYVGKEDSLTTMYPRDISISVRRGLYDENNGTDEEFNKFNKELCEKIDKKLAQENIERKEPAHYEYANIYGRIAGNSLDLNSSAYTSGNSLVRQLWLIKLDEYNRLAEKNETLKHGEVLLFAGEDFGINGNSFSVKDHGDFSIKERITSICDVIDKPMNNLGETMGVGVLIIGNNDYDELVKFNNKASGGNTVEFFDYSFNVNIPDEQQSDLIEKLNDVTMNMTEDNNFEVSMSSKGGDKESFYSLYGSLFMLGIMLSIVFIGAAVLIMYYKQISEGYEDVSRFDIMQKVGMTHKEIKKTINSQVVTVFTAPLIMAGIHICFAFPMLQKMLLVFGLVNKSMLIMTTAVTYIVFAVIYAIVYKITSYSYYKIVSK